MVVVVGISFNLIIIRVDQSYETSAQSSSSQMESGGRSFSLRFIRTSASQTASQPVEVMISRDVDRDHEVSDPDSVSHKDNAGGKTRWSPE